MCKEYYIIIDGQNVPVTEEVYYTFLRPVWKEHKRERMRSSREISLDKLIENGIDIPDDARLCATSLGIMIFDGITELTAFCIPLYKDKK